MVTFTVSKMSDKILVRNVLHDNANTQRFINLYNAYISRVLDQHISRIEVSICMGLEAWMEELHDMINCR